MNNIQSKPFEVLFGIDAYTNLSAFIEEKRFSKVFILVDENTLKHCIPVFKNKFKLQIPVEIITISAGELFKNLDTCKLVWNELLLYGADRNSLLINLGGGMVTDLGGFVAATYKRGINFINIPTSLLGMVDASIGGKTGVDLGKLKNIIGVFSNPDLILLDEDYLITLPIRELKCGLAEVIKYGLISDIKLWNQIKEFNTFKNNELIYLINNSICIKKEVVQADFYENNYRKVLNFGHTIGHAFESYFLDKKDSLNHGEAVAIGLIIELYLSHKIHGFPLNLVEEVKCFVQEYYGKIKVDDTIIPEIMSLLHYDKKNLKGKVLFVLLSDPGLPIIDCEVKEELILEAINYYRV